MYRNNRYYRKDKNVSKKTGMTRKAKKNENTERIEKREGHIQKIMKGEESTGNTRAN